MPPFRDLVKNHFSHQTHRFIVHGVFDGAQLEPDPDMLVCQNLLSSSFLISREMRCADQIIIHGLFSNHLLYLLFLNSQVLGKCHWVMWGGDLYVGRMEKKDWRWHKNEFFRRFVIKRLGYLVTYVPGDYLIAKEMYGAKGTYEECIMYPSNVFHEICETRKDRTVLRIQVGNSADPTNLHHEIFRKLERFKESEIQVCVPLSYGDPVNAREVKRAGNEIFGEKFCAIDKFMSASKYAEYLSNIDIAIFNHSRQQGMGNIVKLLGMGKKVYLRQGVTSKGFFDGIGVKTFCVDNIDVERLDETIADNNSEIIRRFFSENKLIEQYKNIFE
tara:strand:- start:15449 stop:16438 length:990 start_codon:yes stop_codon:yes gene_type:complete